MSNTRLKWWIIERYTAQTGLRYIPCGQLTVNEADAKTSGICGHSVIRCYRTEEEYNHEIERLKSNGQRVL